MIDSPHILHARLSWVRLYEQDRHAGRVCLRCGISRPTLRKWWRRYQSDGLDGLRSRSQRPHHLAPSKRTPELIEQVLSLRATRNLGSKRLQNELVRTGGPHLSTSTIHTLLSRAAVAPLHRPKRTRPFKRYSRPYAGDRVQIDSMKVANGLYQFTAVDDCTRMRVLGLYKDHTGTSAAHFFEKRVMPEMPFPVERVQTDRGSEFISGHFVDLLRKHRVKLRPNRPRAPHLNGKVERSQQTDQMEFYALEIHGKGKSRQVIERVGLEERLAEWQLFYNEQRAHSSLGGKTPRDRLQEVEALTPSRAEMDGRFDERKERTSVPRGWHYRAGKAQERRRKREAST